MSAKHTPGKLIAETKQSDLETNDPRCSIGIVNGKILFTTTIVNAPNNAVRLCKCWNSHDALLEACKAAQIMLLQSNWNGDDRINIVSAAIAQAEKEG